MEVFLSYHNLFFGNNLLLFLVSIFSISAIINFTKHNIYNGLIIVLLIISNVQFSIYHKYYDPLLSYTFFSIFDMNLNKINIKKIKFSHFYLFFIIFLTLNYFKANNMKDLTLIIPAKKSAESLPSGFGRIKKI